MKINVKRFTSTAIMPIYAHVTDAGADIYSDTTVLLYPGERQLVGTGLGLEIPYGYVGLIHPRSGLANKYGLSVVNTPGTIDSGYRGEIMVNLINLGDQLVKLEAQTRIAQLLIQKVESAEFMEVEELNNSDRNSRGHGSTGVV
jgi:dUTP pyrophosphatase